MGHGTEVVGPPAGLKALKLAAARLTADPVLERIHLRQLRRIKNAYEAIVAGELVRRCSIASTVRMARNRAEQSIPVHPNAVNEPKDENSEPNDSPAETSETR